MKKMLITVALLMGALTFVNSANAMWTCVAMNKANPPSSFPASMSGPSARAIAKSNALQACQNSPLTRYASNCYISSCTYTHN